MIDFDAGTHLFLDRDLSQVHVLEQDGHLLSRDVLQEDDRVLAGSLCQHLKESQFITTSTLIATYATMTSLITLDCLT